MGLRPCRPGRLTDAVPHCLRQLRAQEPHPDDEPGVLKWGSVFTDEQMAAAMIDWLAHHDHLLMTGGRSYRMKHALMRQDAVVEPAS